MVRIATDRSALDGLLDAVPGITVLLLSGGDHSPAEAVHDFWEGGDRKPWRKAVLVTDLAVLTDDEQEEWFENSTGRYAILGRESKDVADSGPVEDLQKQDGSPSIRKLLRTFRKGDER